MKDKLYTVLFIGGFVVMVILLMLIDDGVFGENVRQVMIYVILALVGFFLIIIFIDNICSKIKELKNRK